MDAFSVNSGCRKKVSSTFLINNALCSKGKFSSCDYTMISIETSFAGA